MIGKYTAKVDEKGRLSVPAKLRGELGRPFLSPSAPTAAVAAHRLHPGRVGESLRPV